MKRRHFIKKTGVVGGMAILPIPYPMGIPKKSYKMGYQLFSVRDEMDKDPIATLKSLKAMGYEDFEIYGYDDAKGHYYGLPASTLKSVLDDLELTVTSGHYGFSPYLEKSEDHLKRFVERCIVGAKKLGSKYITWPWLAPEQRTVDNFKLMAYKLNLIGEQLREANLGFAYHNHGFEFENYYGEQGFDIILKETDAALVKLQMDMYWVMHSADRTPEELIDAQPGRYVMWHIKDMHKITRDYTEMGNGSINYQEILPDPSKSGLEFYYLEQGGNFASSSIKSAADSAAYFKSHIQSLI